MTERLDINLNTLLNPDRPITEQMDLISRTLIEVNALLNGRFVIYMTMERGDVLSTETSGE